MNSSQETIESRKAAPGWAIKLDRWLRCMTEDLGGGPRVIRIAQMINFHKIFTVFLIYGMMVYFDNFSTASWIFLALHGTYGYCWLIKDFAFRDIYFDKRVTFGGVFATYAGLVGWVVVPWCWLGVFLPRMLLKDASISRYSAWPEYHERSGLLVPWRIFSGRAILDRVRSERT